MYYRTSSNSNQLLKSLSKRSWLGSSQRGRRNQSDVLFTCLDQERFFSFFLPRLKFEKLRGPEEVSLLLTPRIQVVDVTAAAITARGKKEEEEEEGGLSNKEQSQRSDQVSCYYCTTCARVHGTEKDTFVARGRAKL